MTESKDFYSDNEGYSVASDDRSYPQMLRKDQNSSYPLTHSTSIPNDAHVSKNWPTTYSRSSSISAESYYPSSEAETITRDSEDEDLDDDSYIRPMKTYDPRYKIPGSLDMKDMIDSTSIDREKTPVMSEKSGVSTFTMDDLIKASNDLKDQDRKKANPAYAQHLDVYPATIIQEKAAPAVAMSRRTREDNVSSTQRPPSRTSHSEDGDLGKGAIRKRNRAPEPPPHEEPIYETCSPRSSTQSRPISPDMSHHSRPDSPKYSEPIRAKEFGKRSELTSTAVLNYPISSRKHTSADDYKTERAKRTAEFEYEREAGIRREAIMETSVSRIDSSQPAFSYPIMRSKSGSSSHLKHTKEQKRNLIEEKKSFAQKSTGYQRTGGHLSEDESYRERSNLHTSDLQSDPSSSNSGTCPHCKIHSWLPHSAGCPNSQHNIKRPSTSMALYRK